MNTIYFVYADGPDYVSVPIVAETHEEAVATYLKDHPTEAYQPIITLRAVWDSKRTHVPQKKHASDVATTLSWMIKDQAKEKP
jgi:hypothetical protein